MGRSFQSENYKLLQWFIKTIETRKTFKVAKIGREFLHSYTYNTYYKGHYNKNPGRVIWGYLSIINLSIHPIVKIRPKRFKVTQDLIKGLKILLKTGSYVKEFKGYNYDRKYGKDHSDEWKFRDYIIPRLVFLEKRKTVDPHFHSLWKNRDYFTRLEMLPTLQKIDPHFIHLWKKIAT